MPLFYLFWRAISGDDDYAGGAWALLAGSIAAMLQFFLGSMVEVGGFGLSRWVSACIDIVALPALAPILVYLVLFSLKAIKGSPNFTNFALLWLIPSGVIRSIGWSHLNDPIYLVLVPILWTSIVVGIPFFINLIKKGVVYIIILSSLAIIIVPLAAASSHWAFYSQKISIGALFLLAASAPMLVSAVLSFINARG